MTNDRLCVTNDSRPGPRGAGHSPFVLPGGAAYTAGMEIETPSLPRRIRSNRVLRHLLYWLLPFVGFLMLVRAFETTRTAVEVAVTIFLPAPITAYLHFFVLKRFFETRRYWLYGLCVVLTLSLSSVLTSRIHDLIVRDESSSTSGLGAGLLVILLSTGLHYFSRGVRQQYRLQEAEARQLETELAMLRTQLHPHFLFNTLNGLYALALERSDRMPDVVLKLSELLRYTLDSGEKQRVPLADEIRFLENYVALERLRLDGEPDLRLEIDGNTAVHRVAPMLLAPFVENAFKHGDLGLRAEAFIHIRLVVEAGRLRLTVANSCSGGVSSERTGLGLANVRRRLDLLLPDRHRLEIQAAADRHEIVLEVWT